MDCSSVAISRHETKMTDFDEKKDSGNRFFFTPVLILLKTVHSFHLLFRFWRDWIRGGMGLSRTGKEILRKFFKACCKNVKISFIRMKKRKSAPSAEVLLSSGLLLLHSLLNSFQNMNRWMSMVCDTHTHTYTHPCTHAHTHMHTPTH